MTNGTAWCDLRRDSPLFPGHSRHHRLRDLSPDDWRRICDALRYLGRDLHHRSFSVTAERRELLWQEMDQCLALADRLSGVQVPSVDQED
jgi:hypothetical protein